MSMFCGVVPGALSSLAVILLSRREILIYLKCANDICFLISLPHDVVCSAVYNYNCHNIY